MKIKKLFILFLMSLFAISLVSCGKDNGDDNDYSDDDNGNGGSGSTWVVATIEGLVTKYNGFEIQYSKDNEYIYVGGKDNVYWVLHLSRDSSEVLSTSVISVKKGDNWTNYYYIEGDEKFYVLNTTPESVAKTTADAYFIGYMQTDLDEGNPVSANLKGENCDMYSILGMYNIWVNPTDHYTMQFQYGASLEGYMAFEKVVKGASVEVPEYEEK